jgi:hypothetical protein
MGACIHLLIRWLRSHQRPFGALADPFFAGLSFVRKKLPVLQALMFTAPKLWE